MTNFKDLFEEVNERVKFIKIKNEDIVEFNFEDGSILSFEKNGTKWQEGAFEAGDHMKNKPRGWGKPKLYGLSNS